MESIIALIGIALLVIGALTEADALVTIGALLLLFCLLLLVIKFAKKANNAWVTGQEEKQKEIDKTLKEIKQLLKSSMKIIQNK